MAYSKVLIFWCLRKGRWTKFLPFTVLLKWLQSGSIMHFRSVWGLSWSVWGHLAVSVGVCLCLFCLWMSGGVSIDLGDIFGMPELLGGVWDSLHEGFSLTGANSPIWPNPEKQDVLSPDSFEASKYQNLPICHFQKWLSFAIFLIFCVCQREITIYSLFGSPCSIA